MVSVDIVIGNHAKILAGSVVLKKVKEWLTVFGVPTLLIK